MNEGRTAVVVGVGLIGGSIGLALRRAGWHVVGVEPDAERAAHAVEAGAVDEEGVDPDLGSDHHNIQISGLLEGAFSGVLLDAELGYLMTMAKDDLNPGDFIYANVGVGYAVTEMVTPKLQIMFANGTNAAFDGESIDDTASQWLALGVGADFAINEMLTAYAGWNTYQISQGYNLPYGMVLMGIPPFVQQGVQGLLIIVAVALALDRSQLDVVK